ncbi:Tyrosinase cofactor [Streptomyces venezuelae]|uniref:apotyrosinase chaperone MelC1 n=1 Tax=Streptomyces gardneri TaxID=66892 RepID=UPI0006BC0E2A|nr:tyrosinase cofactor [Streptomyces gardneri]ALO12689.1 Tyrosinase cofactor [Streptomyces venezuelae]QPK49414.1 tyrosinase cofactor [Streptomyces gardneri]WRK40947.1 tyrosinase cofactor [Streptomyces venezuelae]CUM36670.1 Tyrosinase cofactor [Streptomyces venezuelae]
MSHITRRRALGIAAGAAGAAAGLAVAGSAVADAPRAAAPAAGPAPASFDEVYQGRRIQGGPAHGGGHHGGHHGGGYSVTIDGEELHVMQNADGTWISVINHYEPVATPKSLARAAVRELQGAPLVPLTLG